MIDRLVVTWLRGPRAGTRQELRQDVVIFGRRAGSDVLLPEDDPAASGRHAEARRVADGWVLRDLGSMNGTWIGDTQVVGERALTDGTVVELGRGGPLLRLDLVDEAVVLPTVTRLSNTPLARAPATRPAVGRTAMYKAIVQDTVRSSSRRLRRLILGVGLALVVAVVVLAWVLSRGGDRAAGIAQAHEATLFMLIADDGGRLTGFCTAFAVSPDGVLATNAHCVRTLKDLRAAGATIRARMNRAPARTWTVARWKEHPAYDGTAFSADVGLLGLDLQGATLPAVVTLASATEARALAPGQTIYTMGFPGQVMNEEQPAADFREAVVSRLTTWRNAPGDAADTRLVWHSALTSKGTSGSPIFDGEGRVVAVNNGGLSTREVYVKDAATGELRPEVIAEATGLNFGVRVDVLAELLH